MSNPPDLAGPVAFAVSVDGTQVVDTIQVLRIEVVEAIGEPARATLVVRYWDGGTASVSDTASEVLKGGRALTVGLGYGPDVREVFDGRIAKLVMRCAAGRPPELEVRAVGPAVGPRGPSGEPNVTLELDRDIRSAEIATDTPGAGRHASSPDAGYGTIECAGDARLRVGGTVEVVGLGRSFCGPYDVTRVEHRVTPDGYTTRVDLGTPPAPA